VVPSLLVTSALGTANAGRVSLRGIGQGDPSSSAEPAVGIYVDGVYQARFQASASTPALVAVTVIREDCRNVPVSVTVNGTAASVSINSESAMSFDGRTAVVP